jgi:hypothetical protein
VPVLVDPRPVGQIIVRDSATRQWMPVTERITGPAPLKDHFRGRVGNSTSPRIAVMVAAVPGKLAGRHQPGRPTTAMSSPYRR